MLITWRICVLLRNGGWVDVVWAYSIGVLSLGYYFLNDRPSGASALGLWLILLWSLRLGSHLAHRIATEPEDGRYQELKKIWGGLESPMMFGFFMIQATASFLFSLPPLLSMRHADPHWGIHDLIAITIAILALSGETIADQQLKRFKSQPHNQKAVCKVGLWRYSRHPNYFFEWLFWVAFPAAAWASPAFYPTAAAPLIMLFLVLKFSGIPPTEAQAIRKRGEAYREYQRETSAFFPWFPKKNSHPKSA